MQTLFLAHCHNTQLGFEYQLYWSFGNFIKDDFSQSMAGGTILVFFL